MNAKILLTFLFVTAVIEILILIIMSPKIKEIRKQNYNKINGATTYC